MRVLLAGGGTGGHIYPAITIAKALQEKGAHIRFVGTRDRLESDIVPREGFDIEFISVDYFPRRLSVRLVKSVFTAMKGFKEAYGIVKSFKPDVCIGTGGYVSGPVVLAAAMQKIPTIIQEQNVYPGLTNKWLSRVSRKVALSFDEARPFFPREDKLVVTGNPVRKDIVETTRQQGLIRLGLKEKGKIVLVFGGSQGAETINNAVIDAAKDLGGLDAQVIIATGHRGFQPFIDAYKRKYGLPEASSPEQHLQLGNMQVVPYVYDMAAALAVADLIVCRASAGSIAEVTAKGIPSILIPYPHAAENHQEKNARVMEAKGASKVILDAELTGNTLFQAVSGILHDHQRMDHMSSASKRLGKPDAVWDIVALVESVVSQRK